EEESRGEFDIVAGGAHRDDERCAINSDLQRLLNGEGVPPRAYPSATEPLDPSARGDSPHAPTIRPNRHPLLIEISARTVEKHCREGGRSPPIRLEPPMYVHDTCGPYPRENSRGNDRRAAYRSVYRNPEQGR